MKKLFSLVLTLLTVSTAMGLDSNGTDPNSTGTLQIRLMDSETSTFGLTIQIVNVEVYSPSTGWISLNNYEQSISSLSFTRGDATLIANAQIPAVSYTKLRLTFGDQNLIYNVSSSEGQSTLSFEQYADNSVEITLDKLVQPNDTAEITVNFDVSTSVIVQNESYFLNPVLQSAGNSEPTTIEVANNLTASTIRH